MTVWRDILMPIIRGLGLQQSTVLPMRSFLSAKLTMLVLHERAMQSLPALRVLRVMRRPET